MKFYCLKHVPFEGPANLEKWALANSHEFITACSYEYEFPKDPFDILVSMGGPMSANDDKIYPWLQKEKSIMEQALRSGKKIIGICLGAQIAAAALGAKISKNPEKEIGWFDISITEKGKNHPVLNATPEKFPVFHWHGETFEIPEGAIHLYKSEACINQAYLYTDQILGLQFHMEGSQDSLISMMENSLADMTPGAFVQTEETIRRNTPKMASSANSIFNNLISNFIGL